MPKYIQFVIENGIATITLNRPDKRNALKRDFITELKAAVAEVDQRQDVRLFLLKAAGSVFCAGMDLGEMQVRAQAADKQQQWQQDSVVYGELLTAIYKLAVPTVAVLQGPVLAGGTGLVFCCDLVIATDNVFFALPEPMRGITAAMVTPFLALRAGYGPAAYMLLSGKRVSANDAFRFGVIHELVENDQLQEKTDELAQSILTGSKSALAITKQHLHKCTVAEIEELVQESIAVSAKARETDDAREGLAAFLEKRKPNWIQE